MNRDFLEPMITTDPDSVEPLSLDDVSLDDSSSTAGALSKISEIVAPI